MISQPQILLQDSLSIQQLSLSKLSDHPSLSLPSQSTHRHSSSYISTHIPLFFPSQLPPKSINAASTTAKISYSSFQDDTSSDYLQVQTR